MENKLILITNPGSSSRKYALYKGNDEICSLHFEYEGKDVICTLKKADGSKKVLKQDFKELTSTVANINRILTEEGILIRNKEYVLVKSNPESKSNPIED